MTTQLNILTPFADLAELTENFAQRVDEQRLMLPYPEPMPDGEWVQFVIQLADATTALTGVGRVQGSFDNGEEHPPEYRYDVVLDSLQLEGMHEVMFERLLVARQTQLGGEPVTGEVSVEELQKRAPDKLAEPSAVEEEAELAAAVDADGGWEDASESEATPPPQHAAPSASSPSEIEPGTGEVDVGDIEDEDEAPRVAAPAKSADRAAARAPAQPYPTQAREPGKLPSPHAFNGHALTRPSLVAAWSPEVQDRPEAAQSSGLFDYQGGVPRPAHPPRPELDAAQRVQPAPRPGAPWPRRGTGQHAIVGPASEPAAAGFEDLGVEEQLTTGGGDEATSQFEAPAGEPEHEEW